MSKQLAENTLSIILNEIKKDVADSNMSDFKTYCDTLNDRINSYLTSVKNCKHENTKRHLSTSKIDPNGKKLVLTEYTCDSCGRVFTDVSI